uniref:Uncharacterized protein n=1 Tax=Parascaris equorum TaxID=6256 RepID=A0A914RHS3_PAREQ
MKCALSQDQRAQVNVIVALTFLASSYRHSWYSKIRLATALFCSKLDIETRCFFADLEGDIWGSKGRTNWIDRWAWSVISDSDDRENEDDSGAHFPVKLICIFNSCLFVAKSTLIFL